MQDAAGCRFILDSPGEGVCGAPTKIGQSYCAEHHAICYLALGSKGELAERQRIDRFANAVGGRRSTGRQPSERFLSRLTLITAKRRRLPRLAANNPADFL
jgi:hypothetical protein